MKLIKSIKKNKETTEIVLRGLPNKVGHNYSLEWQSNHIHLCDCVETHSFYSEGYFFILSIHVIRFFLSYFF